MAKLKLKGCYWHPAPGEGYAESISKASPSAWYKDLGNIVSTRAAIAAMVQGLDPETFIRAHTDPFDFMLRTRATGDAKLYLGGRPVQRTLRYYIASGGAPLTKIASPKGAIGAYKRAPRVSEADYDRAMAASGGAWVAGICTANQSRYEMVTTNIEAGWKVAECNDAADFRWENVDYNYYVQEAKKLIIM